MAPIGVVEDGSLMHCLNEGDFGRFRDAIEDLDFDWTDFSLPRIIVVGSESAGKSSLIENITKCAVFPRNRNICTKRPVVFEMKTDRETVAEVEYDGTRQLLPNKDRIWAVIQELFDRVGNGIEEQEVVVRITAQDAPMVTLTDTIGIRTYPQELAQQSQALVERYLALPDTLVICVVQATDQLTANNAVALVMDALGEEMKDRAILVLTKPDIVAEEQWDEKVVSRLDGTSAELDGVQFAARVSVISRGQNTDGTERMELARMDAQEKDWWPQRLPENLLGQVGVQSLIAEVSKVFSRRIRMSWKPRAMEVLKGKKQRPLEQLEALGPDPSTLTAEQVHDDVCMRLPGIGTEVQFDMEPLAVQEMTERGCDWAWAAQATTQSRKVREWAGRLLSSPKLLENIRAIITEAFANASELKTQRFTRMCNTLIQIAEQEFEMHKQRTATDLDQLVVHRLNELWSKAVQTPEDLLAIRRVVERAVMVFIYTTVCKTTSVSDAVQLSLDECPDVRDQRAALNGTLHLIDQAMDIIQGLQ